MKISDAFRKAFRTYFGRFGAAMGFFAAELSLLLICLTPLLFLNTADLKYAALLCVPLLVFIMLPARINAACAMQGALNGGSLLSLRLADPSVYGGKLACALKRVGLILLWSIPLLVCAVIAKKNYSGETDAFTVMRSVQSFGGGNLMAGAVRIGLIVVAALLLVAVGCAFHSGARHAYVLGDPSLVRGHHGKTILVWLLSLVTILPFLIALVIVICRYMPALSDLSGLLMKTVKLPPLKDAAVTLGIGTLLSLPLLPLRSLLTAAYINGLRNRA